MSVSSYCMTKGGFRPDLENTEEFLATERVMNAIGMNKADLSILTAEDFESQFWGSFDGLFELKEIEMREELPMFITDASSRVQAQALLDTEETTKQLSA